MNSALFIGLFLIIVVGLFSFGLAAWPASSVLGMRIQSLLGRPLAERKKSNVEGRLEQVLEPISKAVPKTPEELSNLRLALTRAGYREPHHAHMYFGIRGLMLVVGVAVMAATGVLFRAPAWAVVVVGVAYVLPRFVLKRMISLRQLAIKLALPDALDLAVICMEAGLSIDQSMARVASELQPVHPDLSDELRLMNLELRAGKPRVEAFRNLAGRSGVDDVRALSAVLVQTDRFGTSIGQALRTHADSLRTERRQRAEEMAAKTGIKMTPVLALFIFPTVLIVVLGPVAVSLWVNVIPMMSK
ncbi:MAG: type II secretion system F family protein [Terriglobales bacterium]